MTSLNAPLALRHGRPLPNRLALAPLTNKQSNPDGTVSDVDLTWLVARSRGGFGLTLTAATFVSPAGRAWAGQPGVTSDAHVPGLVRLADGIREAGGVSAVQLHHGGLRADPEASGEQRVAPWTDADLDARALSTDEVHRIVDDFAAAAGRVERAGIDGVEIHGAHGYLLGAFLDPRNIRDDGYGGDLAGRGRIMHEVIDAIRASTGKEFQVGLRLSPERFGLVPAEMVTLTAEMLARGDLDYVDLSLWDVRKLPGDGAVAGAADAGRGADAAASAGGTLLIDHYIGLPRHGTALGVAGHLNGTADIAWVLDRGADLVFVGKGAIADRDFARHALADAGYVSPTFPVTKQHLREQLLGEPFVEYFSTNWPALVTG